MTNWQQVATCFFVIPGLTRNPVFKAVLDTGFRRHDRLRDFLREASDDGGFVPGFNPFRF
jgi:hypothetical protein